jgi:hypothetical protein
MCLVKLYYDLQSVGQSVLVSGIHLGPANNFSPFLKLFLDSYAVGIVRLRTQVTECFYGFVDVCRVCSFLLFLGLASAAFLRSEARESYDHILLSLFLRLPQLGGPGSCIYFPEQQSNPIIPPGIGLNYVAWNLF